MSTVGSRFVSASFEGTNPSKPSAGGRLVENNRPTHAGRVPTIALSSKVASRLARQLEQSREQALAEYGRLVIELHDAAKLPEKKVEQLAGLMRQLGFDEQQLDADVKILEQAKEWSGTNWESVYREQNELAKKTQTALKAAQDEVIRLRGENLKANGRASTASHTKAALAQLRQANPHLFPTPASKEEAAGK